MSDIHVRYLLIGGGVASGAAVQGIRQIDPAGSIMLVGQEINRPYYRRRLGKDYLLGKVQHEDLFMQSDSWYIDQHVELHTGRAGSHLDVGRQVVTLDNGEEVSFDRLLIATGATAERLTAPGSDLPGIYHLRSIEEADRLRHAALKAIQEGHAHAHGRGKAIVVGGGLLAVELATTVHQMGLGVDIVCPEPGPWRTFTGENISGTVSRFLTNKGISIHADARPIRLEGDGRVQRAVLNNGDSIVTDLVIVSVGIAPNKYLLRGTPIRSETAILTDAECKTNAPEIFAAGECAAIFDPLFEKHRYLKHESSAIETGRLAGRNMAGASEAYSFVNYFGAEIFGLEMAAWGEPRLVHHRIVRGSGNEEDASLVEIGVAGDGRITQIAALGKGINRQLLPNLIRNRVRIDGNEEKIKDPAFNLAELLPSPSGSY